MSQTAWDNAEVNLIAWSRDHDERRRLENRNLWRRHHYDMARVHFSIAEEHRRKAFSFGAEEVNNEGDEAA